MRAALDRRIEHLVSEGLARRQRQRVLFARDLLDILRQRELAAAGEFMAAASGFPFRTAAEGEHVAGIYRQRITLASGRFAMIDDGLGFSLVPWTTDPGTSTRSAGVRYRKRDRGGLELWSQARPRGGLMRSGASAGSPEADGAI